MIRRPLWQFDFKKINMCSFVPIYVNKWVPPHYTLKTLSIKHMSVKAWTPDQWQNRSALPPRPCCLPLCQHYPWGFSFPPSIFQLWPYSQQPFKVLPMRLTVYLRKQEPWGNQLDQNSKNISQTLLERYLITEEVSADSVHLKHNYQEYFTEKPFPSWSIMWHPRSKANKAVHLSTWKFSLGPAPCSIHLFGRFIYLWLVWLFKGGGPTAVNSLSRWENVHDTASLCLVFRYILCSPIFY